MSSGPAAPALGLAAVALTDLRAYFATKCHNPSAAHWDALRDVLNTLDAMARGECPANVHLAALDPGVGKSSAVLAFARALLEAPEHQSTGMIVCVGRIAEARSMADAVLRRCPGARLAVLTSNDEANALSTTAPNEAQLLITTQQRIERTTETQGFEACQVFHYRGSPRAVRAWDEAWLPGVTINLTGDDLLGAVKLLRRHSHGCANDVAEFGVSLAHVGDGEAVDIPDYEALHGFTFASVLAEPLRDDQRATISALWVLCGKTARVRRNGAWGSAILTYKDTLPADLAPLLVLDASGRVRETYKLIEEHRGGLHRLRAAVKDYSPLTVHLWERSGSKGAWTKDGGDLLTGVVETISDRPDEDWLVVAHKAAGGIKDLETSMRRKLPKGMKGAVSVITWGNHMASNLYADHPNVILAGTLFMPPSHYTTLTHLARDMSVASGLASKDAVERITQGEHANLILQALCRGRVRRSDGDRCQPMNAYIIASKRSGIPESIETIFPGCVVRPWRDVVSPLPPSITRALSYLQGEAAKGAETITTKAIAEHLNMNARNFATRVVKDPRWAMALKPLGWSSFKGRGSAPGGVRFRLRAQGT